MDVRGELLSPGGVLGVGGLGLWMLPWSLLVRRLSE